MFRAMTLAVLSCLVAQTAAAFPNRNLTLMSNRNDYPLPLGLNKNAYSSCWSYIHPDGREYAVIGTTDGTAIYLSLIHI